jgi:predicted RNA-binding Zn-ribbon protein involved in translation (DUF1610 family)
MDARPGHDANPHIAMHVVVDGPRSPTLIDTGPVLMRRDGALSFDCGSCGRTLLDRVDRCDATAVPLYQCMACGAMNCLRPE